MRKPIELWQAIVSGMLLIMTGGTLIVNQSNKIVAADVRIAQLEQSKIDTGVQFEKVNTKLDKVVDKLTDILVELQQKQNRKP